MRFDCSFECGNIGKVQALNDHEYDISLRHDTNNPHYRVWFYFSVNQLQKNQRAIFHIINGSKARSLYRIGMTPLVCSTSRPKWERVPQKQVFYYRSPRFKKNYVLSMAFNFDRDDDTYYFAYCYPYSFTFLQKFLSHVEGQNFTFFKRELLCRTVQKRRVDILTITSPASLTPHGDRKKTIFITARVHAGETPASFICHGLLCYLMSSHPGAVVLRDYLVFVVVPMLNPDGVFLGNYRCSSVGYDLNRYWLNPSPWAHAPIKYTRDELLRLHSDESVDLDFFMDIHAHSTCTNAFMFVNSARTPTSAAEKETLQFPKLLGGIDKSFSAQNTRCCKESSKIGTGRRVIGEVLHVAPHCYALEVSMYCFMDHKQRLIPFTEDHYLDLGKNIGTTFLEFYKLSSMLLPSPQQMPCAGESNPRDHIQRTSSTKRWENGKQRSASKIR
eukprot:TRINITY_DN1793_c0_g5_i1.p1 TRINITY_DN1793_c0_g5~~TRINITY_DN1793_c0_g5_i1.p1  ORF type:complete len:444 (+),score=24.06 TRINITY_DN1793_c0_g5_i1:42-1373(+)